MKFVEVHAVIPAPIEAVWNRYTDHRSWTDWAGLGTVTLDREGSPAPNGVGCVRMISRGGVRVFEEVVSFEPPRRMSYRVVKGGIPIKNHLGEVEFEARGEQTLVTWRCAICRNQIEDGRVEDPGARWAVPVARHDALSQRAARPAPRASRVTPGAGSATVSGLFYVREKRSETDAIAQDASASVGAAP